LFNKAQLEAFIMENLITIEKKSEYEILIPYVDCQTRKLFHATKLINEFPFLKKFKLKAIFLEVSTSNNAAVNLYIKNYFIKIRAKEKHYSFCNHKIDTCLFKKK
jgi:ribosomal protein S18 acetylase RimI-like enzyme